MSTGMGNQPCDRGRGEKSFANPKHVKSKGKGHRRGGDAGKGGKDCDVIVLQKRG